MKTLQKSKQDEFILLVQLCLQVIPPRLKKGPNGEGLKLV